MAGYSKNREQNYEIKYLRKVLGQVDDRIQVPESVSADSLRRLLDNIETPGARERSLRRPLRLSLQSGIAYAAAFALIVALFYSTRLYRPDIISGGMSIAQPEQEAQEPLLLVDAEDNEPAGANTFNALEDVPDAAVPAPEPAVLEDDAPRTTDAQESVPEKQPRTPVFGVGGSGRSTLVREQDEYAFYWRTNDLNDPDSTSPVSFEVVDTVTQEIVAQADVPLVAIAQSFDVGGGEIVFIGTESDGSAAICSYDISSPQEPVVQDVFSQEGELVGAKFYDDIVRVASVSESADSDETEILPNAISSEVCVITAFNPKSQEFVTKKFTGVNGAVQLHNLNAYIRYTGHDDNGESRDYIAQIVFDGMDITLGTVS